MRTRGQTSRRVPSSRRSEESSDSQSEMSIDSKAPAKINIDELEANFNYLLGLTLSIGFSSMQYGPIMSSTGSVVGALKY
mmetsp:Transcript_5279/g.8178  ORF Transcript_5279/g.8178 Transcript_5279/m.8178 type:complete len:80 (+) Transcript_5279:202-441(+)